MTIFPTTLDPIATLIALAQANRLTVTVNPMNQKIREIHIALTETDDVSGMVGLGPITLAAALEKGLVQLGALAVAMPVYHVEPTPAGLERLHVPVQH